MMFSRSKLLVVSALIAVLTYLTGCSISPANQQDLTGNYTDLGSPGLNQGSVPIDFSLQDTSFSEVRLADVLKTNHVLLIFYRGDWCPYCIDQFSTIQPVLPELKRFNVKLLAISPDDVATAKNTKRKFGQDYTFLSDAQLSTTKDYGIGSEKDLPHPAVFLIKQSSTIESSEILWMYASTDHKVRPDGEQLLQQIKSLFERN